MTLDLSGAARFGPDLEWVDCVDYRVEPGRTADFGNAIKEYWPQLDAARLKPAYAGVRPKLSGPGESARDFCISGPAEHGLAGIVNLFGMESPGLTSSLALGDYIAAMLAD
jgi:L-2-hydroxyglutarate oxidase LhgO